MKTFYKILIIAFLLPSAIKFSYSQTFDEYKKQEKKGLEDFSKKQQKGIAEMSKKFDDYIKESDKKFADYLKKEWKDFNVFKGIEKETEPKPNIIPKYKKDKNIRQEPLKISAIAPEIKEKEKPILPFIQKSEPQNFYKRNSSFDFYGIEILYDFDNEIEIKSPQIINENSISKWWSEASKTKYNSLVNNMLKLKDQMCLNDYAYYLLIKKTAEDIAINDENEAKLLHWFLMLRSGYQAKIAYKNKKIITLMPSANTLFGVRFLYVNNTRYFIMDKVDCTTISTYDDNSINKGHLINFNISQPLNIGNNIKTNTYSFNFKEKKYKINIDINKNNIDFYKDYPTTDLNIFFNSAMSWQTKESLANSLKPILNNMSDNEAANFLLSFVQKSFKYKTDQEQFGREKFFFPEEVFYYAYSDCEDRSALYTYLVKKLLNLDIIGLEYPGHIATAINFNKKDISGNYLVYNDKKYIIADPTYINAPVGLSMPQVKNKKAKVIALKNSQSTQNKIAKFWDIANKSGGYRGGNLQDLVFDNNGNFYLCGYFINNAKFGDIQLKSNSKKRNIFLAKYKNTGEVQWAKKIMTKGISTGFAIALDKNNNAVVSGSFSGELIGKDIIKTKPENQDIFIAKFSSIGNPLWINKSNLDTINHDQFINYVINVNASGQQIETKLFFENSKKISEGVFINKNSYTIIGSLNNTTGFADYKLSYNDETTFDTINYLKTVNDELMSKGVDQSLAGLVAVLKLIQSNDMVIPGKLAQEAFNKYNPEFKNSYPTVYENIGNVNFIKNSDGIITILTKKKKSVSFSKMKINNKSQLKISSLKDGNEKVIFLSGVEVGKYFVWYNLNFIKLLNTSGELIFDYDTDNTQKKMDLKKDILY